MVRFDRNIKVEHVHLFNMKNGVNWKSTFAIQIQFCMAGVEVWKIYTNNNNNVLKIKTMFSK